MSLRIEDLQRAADLWFAQQYEPDLWFMSPEMAEGLPRILRREERRAHQQEIRWRGRHYLNRRKGGKPTRKRRR